ncbi:MAG: hypothetical protein D6687_09390 [Acidobacteria bacterium]|jgi:hypothetical protein|nr:MAG: hypothetical protein D6687_09390 [Acidobacteriota bacterium]BCW95101.1 MAG: hypothetical protein KatS3mg018_0583 [Fimbriimonadales bacterium]
MKQPKVTRFTGHNVIQSLLPHIKNLLSAGRKRGYSLEQTVVAAASALMILLRDSDQTNVYAETVVYHPELGRKLVIVLSATEIEEVSHAN